MHTITFISTIHEETGNCNAEELYKIIEKLSPEVIFLEAVEKTYSEYERYLFSTYGVYHKKLEIAAIQKYHKSNILFEYVPVCENSLSDALNRKNKIVHQNRERQQLINNFKFLAEKYGFKFLNSLESIILLEEIRVLESQLLNDNDVNEILKADIEAYENPMIRNIYSYCNNNHFNSAIFMCGAAHRKSIIEKIDRSKIEEQANLTWTIFES
ncbi:hypothetical protein [Flavobacterium aquicola]|uniref:TraB family protein n=1 Tax=Flavobacterium aquicola TaxID=1682742 RepID=A0A3E0EN90_9FLAO|nr:hypothetical protein [Flavobacterium aquicola]REG99648.1 hypothetical protein C8P67_104278 [Flavobacterium aquicola]